MDDEATGTVSRRATLRLSVLDVGKEMAESSISDRVDGGARGGLQTPEEKCASRTNAIKHGLTAGELLPAVMGHDVIEQAYEWLLEEWQPSTATQRYLVREMARHEAALERAEEMETAVLRRGARGAPRIAIARRCTEFRVLCVAADGAGNGSVYNNLLLNMLPRLHGLYAMFYSAADQRPRQYKGRLSNWTIGRTPSIGMVFTRIKKQRIHFPRLEDCSSFLDEIWCETAEYDDHNRTIKYTHPETQPDDTLHAINYAATLGRYMLDRDSV